jgi:predicted NUDIX family NTP pyrophosphohydrolase
MNRISAGIVLYEMDGADFRVLLIHPGGPYMKKKDVGHWSIPKGEVDAGEDLLTCAKREFHEETGHDAGDGPFIPLGEIKQKGGKIVHAWGVAGHWDPAKFSSNTFEMEWPPQSGRIGTYPEVDRAEMLLLQAAIYRIKETQRPLLLRLAEALKVDVPIQ